MTVDGGASGSTVPEDVDPFEKQTDSTYQLSMNHKSESQRYKDMIRHRISINWRSAKENPIPYISNDKFSSVKKTSVTIGLDV
jgi:hypothetical protein